MAMDDWMKLIMMLVPMLLLSQQSNFDIATAVAADGNGNDDRNVVV
jgi:hypothetical protein